MNDGRPMSLRARIARLDSLIPEDADKLCCLEGFVAYREVLSPWSESLHPHLRLKPGDPNPPLEPPELPLGGICKKTRVCLCPFALERVSQVWRHRRRLAVTTVGLDESQL